MSFDVSNRPNVAPWPPAIFVASLALSLALGAALPLRFAPQPAIGAAVLIAGVALDLWAAATLMAQRTNILPTRPALRLVSTGPYRLTRNPIYLGNALVLLGLAVLTGNLWFALFCALSTFLVDRLAVRREEAHLQLKFGPSWSAYAARTPRWLPLRF